MPFGRDVSLPSDGRGALAVGDEEADAGGGDVAAVLSSMLADVVRWRTGTRSTPRANYRYCSATMSDMRYKPDNGLQSLRLHADVSD